jgi:DNA-binding GntR family transcriptional regulator
LAEEFEVSRGPVREALRILEKDSVVRILPNRGAHVTQLSVKEVSDIFEVRRTLFGAMIGRLTAEEASALAATLGGDIRTLDALAQDPDGGPAYFETMFRLSRIVREACSNDRMSEILGSLARQTLRYSRLGLATPARRKESARNWANHAKGLEVGRAGCRCRRSREADRGFVPRGGQATRSPSNRCLGTHPRRLSRRALVAALMDRVGRMRRP